MARTNQLTTALLLGTTLMAGCALSDPNDPAAGDDGGDQMGSDQSDMTSTPVYPTAHPRIYIPAHRSRLKASLDGATPQATAFKSLVDSWVNGSDIWGFEVWNAALMGQLTGNATYCTKAIAAVQTQVAAAESKIASGSAPDVASDSYLNVGDMIGDLALTYDWCFDKLTSTQKSHWLAYADQAVFNVWHPTTAKWGSKSITWSGWATNDPSDNYYYSFLKATMLLGLASKGEDPQADTWVAQFRDTKVYNQLIPTFNSDLTGGGSREGTGYGVAMRRLFELYDWWRYTTGETLSTKTAHTRMSMFAMLHQMLPTRDRVAPTGDLSRDSTAAWFDYHRNYLQELIWIFRAQPVAAMAKTQLQGASLTTMSNSFMRGYDFLYDDASVTAAPVTLNTTYYASGIGELYARSGWDTHATWVNMIAGPYTQSHAHQDQGSLMMYKDGWLAYDAVVDSHSGLTQETTAHGLVRIDSGGSPVKQVANTISKVVALHQGSMYTYASADLTPAYNGSSAVQKVNREMLYLKPDVVVVFDRVQSASGTSQTWQLASPKAASISGATASISNAGHTLKVQRIAGGSAYSVKSMTGVSSDYGAGYRLDETMSGGNNRYLHVLSVDSAVSSTTSAGDTTHPGVTVHMSNGHTATVTFNRDTAGATLVLDGSTITLGTGVDSLPE